MAQAYLRILQGHLKRTNNCKWATLYVDKHTITGKTYLNTTFVGEKKLFGLL